MTRVFCFSELTLSGSNGEAQEEPVPSRRRLNTTLPSSALHQSNGLSNGNLANGDDDEDDEDMLDDSLTNDKSKDNIKVSGGDVRTEKFSSDCALDLKDSNNGKSHDEEDGTNSTDSTNNNNNNEDSTNKQQKGKNGKIGTLAVTAEEEAELLCGDLSPEQLAKRAELVSRLQVQLRTEEMKLVLLKKLKQSQVRKCPVHVLSLCCLLAVVNSYSFLNSVI